MFKRFFHRPQSLMASARDGRRRRHRMKRKMQTTFTPDETRTVRSEIGERNFHV